MKSGWPCMSRITRWITARSRNIPKGQYGAGSVVVWDEGRWMPEGDPAAGMKKGYIRFELLGHKLNGAWHLVRLKPRPGEKRDNWLLIKSDDAFCAAG